MFQSLPMRLRSTPWGNSTSGNNTDSCAPNPRGPFRTGIIYTVFEAEEYLPPSPHTHIHNKEVRHEKKEQEHLCVSAMGRGRDGGREKVVGMLFLVFYWLRAGHSEAYIGPELSWKNCTGTLLSAVCPSSSSSSSQLKHSLIIIFKLF